MSDTQCTEARRVKMDAMWALLEVPFSGCADVLFDNGEMRVSQIDEVGNTRQFEIRRESDGYNLYQSIACPGENVRCGIFREHLTREAFDAAYDLYIDLLWDQIFSRQYVCFYLDYPDREETICKPL